MKLGATVWFTGLPCSGKTTISNYLFNILVSSGCKAELLDGDVVRQGISKGLGYSEADRRENIRRIGSVAEQLTRSGLIVLVAAISPYRSARDHLRKSIPNFIEVYINAPLAVCEKRDVKGLYHKARKGELLHFTGVDAPYEPPLNPEVVCNTDREMVEESAMKIYECLRRIRIMGL